MVFKWIQQHLLGAKRVQVCCVQYNINITVGNNPAYVKIVNIY